ncbi:unnamed protein product [Musa hybrid cultivar]
MINNTVHQERRHHIVTILNKDNDLITLNNMYHISSMKKNLFSITNTVNTENYIYFSPNEVQFLHNIKELNIDLIHTSKRINDLYILLAFCHYVDRMSTNDSALIWYARLWSYKFS